jgi:hypothetical protein
MGLHIMTIPLNPIVQLLLAAALPVTGVIRAWISYRRAIDVEQWRTRRFVSALRSTKPEHRADIIAACAYMEAACSTPCDPRGRSQSRRDRITKQRPNESQ